MKIQYPLEYEQVNPGEEIHNNKPEFKFKNLSKRPLAFKVKELLEVNEILEENEN